MRFDPTATHARSRPRGLAIVDLGSGQNWTWEDCDAEANRIAAYLLDSFGERSGMRIATLAHNSALMVLLQISCTRAGTIFVPLNWRLSASEIATILADAQPAILFVDPEFSECTDVCRQYSITDLPTLVADFAKDPAGWEARLDWDAPMTLLYTSGTSGTPKGVMISDANAYWSCTNFIVGNTVCANSVFLCDLPLFHTAGLFAATRTPLLAGGTVVISAAFDPAQTLRCLADPVLGITHYFAVPQMAQILWNHPDFAAEAFSGLKVFATGGAPNPAAQIERFVTAGIPMSDGFGMTETGSNFGMPVDDRNLLIAKAGSCGLPYLFVECRIVDDRGDDVAEGEAGELLLRGPGITSGYWNQPERTAESFSDGWFRTGDAARRDSDGFYFLADRRKDMFISGGENIYPAEVEAVIAQLDFVAECAVIGVPDPVWGEVGKAYVIGVTGATIEAAQIIEYCRSRLAAFKVPKSVILDEPIPRTASGKVQKHLLRQSANT